VRKLPLTGGEQLLRRDLECLISLASIARDGMERS
jgi:molybdenum cofactor biosynthesis enzyme MoaA